MSAFLTLQGSSARPDFVMRGIYDDAVQAQAAIAPEARSIQDVQTIILAVAEKVDDGHARIVSSLWGRAEAGVVVPFTVPEYLRARMQ